ncbi:MAG: hypothetical protein ABI700_13170 [Chloroflexota bacterium]
MPNVGVFADEWRECLRAHFTTVIRMNDKITEKTLRGVMIEAGFSDAELRELTVRATMHVDDVGADFVPDMTVLETEPVIVPGIALAVPQEIIEAAVVEESLALDEAYAETTAEAIAADLDETTAADDQEEVTQDDVTQDDEPPPDDPDVTQLSLF